MRGLGRLLPGGLQFKSVSELVAAMTAAQTRPDEQHLVPMMVVHSSNDGTVPFENGQNIRDVWIARYNASTDAEERDCTHEAWRASTASTATARARPWPRPCLRRPALHQIARLDR